MKIKINDVVRIVCSYYDKPIEVINIKSGKREFAKIRQVCHYMARKHTNETLENVGAQIGNKDHGTVLHSCRTIAGFIQTDKIIRREIEDITILTNRFIKEKKLTLRTEGENLSDRIDILDQKINDLQKEYDQKINELRNKIVLLTKDFKSLSDYM